MRLLQEPNKFEQQLSQLIDRAASHSSMDVIVTTTNNNNNNIVIDHH